MGCSNANLYALIAAGELPVIAVGKSRGYRIARQAIEEFLRRRTILKNGHPSIVARPRRILKHIKL
jgi:excisionase family DNA binding protein